MLSSRSVALSSLLRKQLLAALRMTRGRSIHWAALGNRAISYHVATGLKKDHATAAIVKRLCSTASGDNKDKKAEEDKEQKASSEEEAKANEEEAKEEEADRILQAGGSLWSI